MDLDFIDAIRLRALRAVWKPDTDALLRRCFRWYSEKYHTPLHEVEELPLEDILEAWYEVQYENLAPDERHNLAIFLLETEEERREREISDRNSEADFLRQTLAKVEKQKKVDKPQKKIGVSEKPMESGFRPLKNKPMKEVVLGGNQTGIDSPGPVEIVLTHSDGDFEDGDFVPSCTPKK